MKLGKKIISVIAAFIFVLSLSACGSNVVKPEEAFKNLSKANQGKVAVQFKMTGTGKQVQAADVALNYVFGASKDSKKVGVSLAILANITANNAKPINLDGRLNIDGDISVPATPALNIEAGASADTISQFGAGVTGAMVITANLADLKKLSGVSEEEFKTQLDQFYKAMATTSNPTETSTKNKELVGQILSKITEAIDKAGIKSVENGDKTVKVGSEEFSGKEYEYTITPDNMKTIMNSLVDAAPEIITTLKTLSSTNGANKDAMLKELDSFSISADNLAEAKKSIEKMDMKDNVTLKVLIGSDGMPASITLGTVTSISGENANIEIAIGMKDLMDSEDGMAYYTKNKAEMYKGATVLPIGNFTGMFNN